jgi:hypothetical protein
MERLPLLQCSHNNLLHLVEEGDAHTLLNSMTSTLLLLPYMINLLNRRNILLKLINNKGNLLRLQLKDSMDSILHPLNLDTNTAKNTSSPAPACSPKDSKDKLE